MSDNPRGIYRKEASDSLLDTDALDHYVRVTTPSSWIILAAIVVFSIGLLIWAVFGAVSTSVTTTGTSIDGEAICLLSADEAAKVRVGDQANVGGTMMQVNSVASIPFSKDEAHEILENDYLVSALMGDNNWGYLVTFEGEPAESDLTPLTVVITTERVAPISLLFDMR